MDYYINPIEEERCVCLSCGGDLSPEGLSTMSREAHSLVSARCWNRVVVDITQSRSSLSASQILDFAKTLANISPHGARVALVVRPGQAQETALLDNVSIGDGVLMACFVDPEKASLWVAQARLTLPAQSQAATPAQPAKGAEAGLRPKPAG